MIGLDQILLVEKLLSSENVDELIKYIILKYADSTDKISTLLKLIPDLAANQLDIKQRTINQYAWSTDLLIGNRHVKNKGKRMSKEAKFPMLLYTCKVHFPTGNSEKQSISCKEFFQEFIDILKEKNDKVFNYESEDDWNWIYTSACCADWLESVIKQNIDENFVKPENKHKMFFI